MIMHLLSKSLKLGIILKFFLLVWFPQRFLPTHTLLHHYQSMSMFEIKSHGQQRDAYNHKQFRLHQEKKSSIIKIFSTIYYLTEDRILLVSWIQLSDNRIILDSELVTWMKETMLVILYHLI